MIKLADGTWLVGDTTTGPSVDFNVADVSIADVRWLKLDIERVVTRALGSKLRTLRKSTRWVRRLDAGQRPRAWRLCERWSHRGLQEARPKIVTARPREPLARLRQQRLGRINLNRSLCAVSARYRQPFPGEN